MVCAEASARTLRLASSRNARAEARASGQQPHHGRRASRTAYREAVAKPVAIERSTVALTNETRAETVNLRLRIRVDLLRKLEEAAAQDHRPVQTEIMRRLEGSFTVEQASDQAKKASEQMVADMQRLFQARTEEIEQVVKAQMEKMELLLEQQARPRGRRWPIPSRRTAKQEKQEKAR